MLLTLDMPSCTKYHIFLSCCYTSVLASLSFAFYPLKLLSFIFLGKSLFISFVSWTPKFLTFSSENHSISFELQHIVICNMIVQDGQVMLVIYLIIWIDSNFMVIDQWKDN